MTTRKMPVQHQIRFFVPEEASTWAQRMEAACDVLEQAFPGEKLLVANSQRDGQLPKTLTDRKQIFGKALRTQRRWVSLFNGKHLVGRGDAGLTDQGFITIGGRKTGGAADHFTVLTIHPDSPWDFNERLLVALGDVLGAYTAALTPITTSIRLNTLQFGHTSHEDMSQWSNRNLPRLRYCAYGGLHASEQPEMLGWLNYWSAATCRYLGFPDAQRDGILLGHSRQTSAGAWLVKLGDEPLDLENDAHVGLLEWAYARFPRLGVRVK